MRTQIFLSILSLWVISAFPAQAQLKCPPGQHVSFGSNTLFGVPSSDGSDPTYTEVCVDNDFANPALTTPSTGNSASSGTSGAPDTGVLIIEMADGRRVDLSDVEDVDEALTHFYRVTLPHEDNYLKLMSSPSTTSREIGSLGNQQGGVRLKALTYVDGVVWGQTCTNSGCGWIVANYLARESGPVTEPIKQPDTFATVAIDKVEVLGQPSLFGTEFIGYLEYGVRVAVWDYAYNEGTDWVYICGPERSWCGWAPQGDFFKAD